MPHQILTVKLCELEKRIAKMQSRIQLSESDSLPRIQAEIESLQKECDENHLALQNKLRHSRTEVIKILDSAYREVEPIIRNTSNALQEEAMAYEDRETSNEHRLLLAEYELDFSMLAIDRALLVSLEAIAAQLETSQGGMEA